jgi:histidine ammonia-lyase
MVKIGENPLSLEDCNRVLYQNEKIEIAQIAIDRVSACYEFLKVFSQDKVIYGINTGFGPMAQYKINHKDQIDLQYNLIRSHSSGTGNKLSDVCVKALMLARLNTLLQAKSGIHIDVINLLVEFINRDIFPVIFEHGSVGASGDLVQLAHLALALIGEGEVTYKGKLVPTAEALKENNLKPLPIHIREGLGIMNGTSVMTGIGITNIIHAKNLVDWSILASSVINEIMESYEDHYSEPLNNAKHHQGQREVAQHMRWILQDSQLIKHRHEHLYNKNTEEQVFKDKVQEYYSIRCVPQIVGPVVDTIKYTEEVLINEINSASDNPIVDFEKHNVFHGGNFHGDYVALEMDKLKIAIVKLSMLCERQINFLLNDKINGKLPPFVNMGRLGLNFGMQGVQFTATSTTAENQTLANPMYIHSISNNNDNQDIVSMGTNAALLTKKVVENTFEVLAIEWMTILQAIDCLNAKDKLSHYAKKIYDDLRVVMPTFIEDSPKYQDILAVKNHIVNNILSFE